MPTQGDLNLPATSEFGQIDRDVVGSNKAIIVDSKFKYMVNRQEQLDIHCNLFDGSFVEYYLDDPAGNFEVIFDQKLYEAPEAVKELER